MRYIIEFIIYFGKFVSKVMKNFKVKVYIFSVCFVRLFEFIRFVKNRVCILIICIFLY